MVIQNEMKTTMPFRSFWGGMFFKGFSGSVNLVLESVVNSLNSHHQHVGFATSNKVNVLDFGGCLPSSSAARRPCR